jgi:hypothetical protein
MCLIIHKPAGTEIPRWVIDSALESNPDGFGIMAEGYSNKWRNITGKNAEAKLRELQEYELAVHFRWATDGKVTKRNAHPFKVKGGSYLMHNGILSKYRTSRTDTDSDTKRFVDTFCNPQVQQHGSIPTAALESEIEGSAICLMLPDGIIKRYGGGWSNHFDLWFSNEYAWDAPGKYSKGYARYIDDDYGDVSVTQVSGVPMADAVFSLLIGLEDVLPFNDCTYIAYDDLSMADDVLDNHMTARDFIECCTDETMLHLYTWAVINGYITQ